MVALGDGAFVSDRVRRRSHGSCIYRRKGIHSGSPNPDHRGRIQRPERIPTVMAQVRWEETGLTPRTHMAVTHASGDGVDTGGPTHRWRESGAGNRGADQWAHMPVGRRVTAEGVARVGRLAARMYVIGPSGGRTSGDGL
jgi:hypothetical protein